MTVVNDILVNFLTVLVVFVLFAVFSKIFYAASVNFNMSNIETQKNITEDDLPPPDTNSTVKETSIIENKKILDLKRNETEYEINGKVFRETEYKMDDGKYTKFEIRDDLTSLAEPSTSTDSKEDIDVESDLSLSIQNVPNGVIINSNVFLSDQNFNTIVGLDDSSGLCGVCERHCKIEEYQEHIRSEGHLNNLASHPPLCKYDLCIIRKLQENYHCGVCNEIFDAKNSSEHFASKNHEDKLLFAVNRVSDITYDLNLHRDVNEPYHFNSNVTDDNDGFYDGYKPEPIKEYDYISSDENLSDIEEPNPFSYASIAKTPQVTPTYVQTEMDGRIMNVRFDSWHMILCLKKNKFYCMVCKIDGHISLKTEHCTSKQHLKKLNKCEVLKNYIGFLIRKVDNRLYHCAHCNNLQLIIDIEKHIDTRHAKRKIKNVNENNNIPMKMKRNNPQTIRNENDCNTDTKMESDKIENRIKELNIFCARFNLSLLSYNMVLTLTDFYCCLCQITVHSDDISEHMFEACHLQNLLKCPFILKYNCNLIRQINSCCFHCAICNVTLSYDVIDRHIMNQNHICLLNKQIILSPTTQLIKDRVENNANTSNTDNDHCNNEIIEGIARTNTGNTKDIVKENHKKVDAKEIVDINEEETDNDSIATKEDLNADETSSNVDIKENDTILLNTEEYVFLKRKNVFARVTYTSYNTLVAIGDGNRFCVLCSVKLEFEELRVHLECREHTDNIRKFKYLEKYEKHLLRQVLHTYHCSVCNVMFNWRELNLHLTWPIHREQLERSHKIVKNNRKNDIKNGTKQFIIEMQKETLYTTYVEPKIKMGVYYEFSKRDQEILKKSKMVIANDIVLKLNWDSWHGLSKTKNGLRCNLCLMDLKSYERSIHCTNGSHLNRLEANFLKEYRPALIRKVNETTLNCVTCNTIVPNQVHIYDHINGKKHKMNYEILVKDSSVCDTYNDCTNDIFIL